MVIANRWATRPSCVLHLPMGALLPRRPLSLGVPKEHRWHSTSGRRWRCRSAQQLGAADTSSRNFDEAPSAVDASQVDEETMQAALEGYIEFCQEKYGMDGSIEFSNGHNGLPMVTLKHPSGSECDVYLHGATVTGWRHVDGRELLYLAPDNEFDGDSPISGGIPIAWPQVGLGPLPTNGFLRHLHWSVVETFMMEGAADPTPTVSFYADTDPEWEQVWPHKFEAVYSVTLMQPEPPEPQEAEILREMEGGEEVDASAMGGLHEEWGPTTTGGPAAAAGEGPKKARRGGGLSSADSDGEEEEGGEGAGSSSSSRRGGSSSTAAPSSKTRSVLGGTLLSSEKLQQQEAKEAKRRDAEMDQLAHEQPSQLRCMLQIHNSGDTPFTFTTALQAHLAAEDIAENSRLVKTVGLRGKYVLDYALNAMRPSLSVEDSDVVFYGKEQIDRVYVDVDGQGDLLHCPGTQSHFELKNREGFRDVMVQNHALTNPEEARFCVGVHPARVTRPVTLEPGGMWSGEMVVRAHRRYWDLMPWEEEDTSQIPAPPTTNHLEDVISTSDSGAPDYENPADWS